MTICAAALAASGKAIVCVADKSLTFGEGTSLQPMTWDADCSKIVPLLPCGMLCLFAGGEDGTSRVLSKFLAKDTFGDTEIQVRDSCEADYKEAIQELITTRFLHPNLLTQEQYISAISRGILNPFMSRIAAEVEAFDFNCETLVCGFDSGDKPFIQYGVSKGVVDNMARTGFQAIGSGWAYVHGRLLWSGHERKHNIDRVLYDLFDAKASAELDPNVGFEWDAAVILAGKRGAYEVPKEIRDLIERIWDKTSRSPFEKRDPKKELPSPPRDWKQKLFEFSYSIITEGDKNAEGYKRLS